MIGANSAHTRLSLAEVGEYGAFTGRLQPLELSIRGHVIALKKEQCLPSLKVTSSSTTSLLVLEHNRSKLARERREKTGLMSI